MGTSVPPARDFDLGVDRAGGFFHGFYWGQPRASEGVRFNFALAEITVLLRMIERVRQALTIVWSTGNPVQPWPSRLERRLFACPTAVDAMICNRIGTLDGTKR